MNYENIVDTYCVTPHNLLFTFLRNGSLYAFQLAEETKLLFVK